MIPDEAQADCGSKPGAEPTSVDIRWSEKLGSTPDSTLVARSDGVAIWHTDKSASHDLPLWLPPFGLEPPVVLYRGFPVDKLHDVLERGLDVPPQCAFFATPYADKAWEYPVGRNLAAMLVLDAAQAKPSYARKPADADDTWRPDKTLYPNAYIHGETEVHTRFEDDRGPRDYRYEAMYGRWVPGDARAALIAVVLGGPRAVLQERLENLHGLRSYGLQVMPAQRPA